MPSTSGSLFCEPPPSAPSANDSVLGNRTRTQFKRESYEIVKLNLSVTVPVMETARHQSGALLTLVVLTGW